MGFRKPLTTDDLRALQERLGNNPDARTLLWEIKRLRAVVLRADQLQRTLGNLAGGTGMILETLRLALADEPCVREQILLPELNTGPRAPLSPEPAGDD